MAHDLFVIFQGKREYILRQHVIRDDGTLGADVALGTGDTLEDCREIMQFSGKGLVRADSEILGVPHAVEAWR